MIGLRDFSFVLFVLLLFSKQSFRANGAAQVSKEPPGTLGASPVRQTLPQQNVDSSTASPRPSAGRAEIARWPPLRLPRAAAAI